MNLLLDSHTFLWWAGSDPTLPQTVAAGIDTADGVAISLATPWELQIKAKTGRLQTEQIDWRELDRRGVELLAPDLDDVLAAADLPLHHRDPFDRLMVAQALRRNLVIVTRDRNFARYGVPILAA